VRRAHPLVACTAWLVTGCESLLSIQDPVAAVVVDAAPAADAGPPAGCPATYSLKFNGHSYVAAPSDTYANVVASCHADGQHVIVINDDNENTWAMDQLISSNNFVWIGLHFTSGAWTWDDGTLLGSGYESFTGGVPTNPTDPCVDAFQLDGSWSAFRCTAIHPTLCECDGP
jgi:hypothetical protein